MAMGKAIVASRTGPGPEVVEHRGSGLLCDPHDPSSIAASVRELLGDRALRKRLGAAARERALRDFSADVMMQRNMTFYQQCLEPVYA
jgi:glycosyltransferase involved in cell wall biosynthesis